MLLVSVSVYLGRNNILFTNNFPILPLLKDNNSGVLLLIAQKEAHRVVYRDIFYNRAQTNMQT